MTSQDPGRDARPRTPWWVKAIGIALVVLLVIALVIVFTGGQHGPGMHGLGSRPELWRS